MSISQKCAWAQLGIFGALVISWASLFVIKGTFFYWQDNSMMIIFYIMSGAAFVALVIMNVVISVVKNHTKAVTDERDRSIFRKASLWATGISYTVVAALLLIVAITYMNGNNDSIPVYFALFIVLIGGVTLLLTQAITALILYGRKVNHAES